MAQRGYPTSRPKNYKVILIRPWPLLTPHIARFHLLVLSRESWNLVPVQSLCSMFLDSLGTRLGLRVLYLLHYSATVAARNVIISNISTTSRAGCVKGIMCSKAAFAAKSLMSDGMHDNPRGK